VAEKRIPGITVDPPVFCPLDVAGDVAGPTDLAHALADLQLLAAKTAVPERVHTASISDPVPTRTHRSGERAGLQPVRDIPGQHMDEPDAGAEQVAVHRRDGGLGHAGEHHADAQVANELLRQVRRVEIVLDEQALYAPILAQGARERGGEAVRDARADRVVQQHHVEAREVHATRRVLRSHGIPETVARVESERLEIIAHSVRMKPPGIIEHQDVEAFGAEGAIRLVRHRVIFSRGLLEDPQSLSSYAPERPEGSIASASRQYSFSHLHRPEWGVTSIRQGSGLDRRDLQGGGRSVRSVPSLPR